MSSHTNINLIIKYVNKFLSKSRMRFQFLAICYIYERVYTKVQFTRFPLKTLLRIVHGAFYVISSIEIKLDLKK